jgi:hypothetical protein
MRTLAVVMLVAVGVLADPALYWGSQRAVTGVASGPDLVGPDGAVVPSGSTWLVQLLDLGSGDVLAAAPTGAIADIGQGAVTGVLYATLADAGPWRGRSVGTRILNAGSAAVATHWALFSATTVLAWDTVPSPPGTFTYDAGHVAQGDWHEIDNRLAPGNRTACIGSPTPVVVPVNLAVDQDLSSLAFVLTFDPTRLRAVSYGAAGRTAVAAQAGGIDQDGGRILFTFSNLGGGVAITAGSGPIAEVGFELQPDVAEGSTPLSLGSVEAWTTALALHELSLHAGAVGIANCSVYTLTYLAGDHGAIAGPTPQAVNHGADAAAVTAVPAFGYHFAAWSDGATANPRRDLHVIASQSLTARFDVSAAVPPSGSFLGGVAATDSVGRRLWDLTGSYVTTVAGQPLTMDLLHEPSGRLTGLATLAVGKAMAVHLPVKGSVKGAAGGIVLKGSLAGADPTQAVKVALALRLTVDPVLRQLVGQITGSIRNNGSTTPVTADVALAIPAPMDGTWTLWFQLDPVRRGVTGTARLTLANGVEYAYLAAGRSAGQGVVLSLVGAPGDSGARAIRMRVSITPLAGGWARLEGVSGGGYGQTLVW